MQTFFMILIVAMILLLQDCAASGSECSTYTDRSDCDADPNCEWIAEYVQECVDRYDDVDITW